MSSYDPTDLRGQEREREDLESRKRLAQEVEDGDLKWLLSSKRGRRIVWRLLDRCGVFRISFNTNAMQMSFNEGNRNFGNVMLSELLNVAPESFALMMRESKQKDDKAVQ